jgi:hypothetical protein
VWHPDRFAQYPPLAAKATIKAQQFNAAFARIRDAPLRTSGNRPAESVVLLARAALIPKKPSLQQDDGLHAVREGLFLPVYGGACQLSVGAGRLTAVGLGTKRRLGFLWYPVIGTVGVPLPGGEAARPMFDICRDDLIRWFVFDRYSDDRACFVYETAQHYFGVTSLDYRAFLQVSENRKLIREAERAYEAIGLRYSIAKRLVMFKEKVYTRDFAAWVYRLFLGQEPG